MMTILLKIGRTDLDGKLHVDLGGHVLIRKVMKEQFRNVFVSERIKWIAFQTSLVVVKSCLVCLYVCLYVCMYIIK